MNWLTELLNSLFGSKPAPKNPIIKPSPVLDPVIEEPVLKVPPKAEAPKQEEAPVVEAPKPPPLTVVKKKVPTRKEMSILLWQFTNGDTPTRVGPYKNVKETDGKNRSKQIDAINLTQGAYLGAPYCQTGVQEVLDEKCRYYGIGRKSVEIPEGAGTQDIWARTHKKYKRSVPDVCCWVSWNSGGGRGHTGEITSLIDSKKFVTLEFNTSAYGQKVERDGEGFYYGLVRDINGYGDVKINGYIDVYQAIVDAMIASGKYEA